MAQQSANNRIFFSHFPPLEPIGAHWTPVEVKVLQSTDQGPPLVSELRIREASEEFPVELTYFEGNKSDDTETFSKTGSYRAKNTAKN